MRTVSTTAALKRLPLILMFGLAACWSGTGTTAAAIDVARDLDSTRLVLEAARDSTTSQLEMAYFLLEWLEETSESASSSGLVEAVARLRSRHDIPISVAGIADLSATGRLSTVADTELRRRLLRLELALASTAQTGEAEFERYRRRLDELLSPGMWRLVFQGEAGAHSVDYRETVRDLDNAGFEREVRFIIRAAEQYAAELDALAIESALLADALRSGRVSG